jgi:hypothetical protein
MVDPILEITSISCLEFTIAMTRKLTNQSEQSKLRLDWVYEIAEMTLH